MKYPKLSRLEELEQRLTRPRKKRPRMRVHGKSVFLMQKLSRSSRKVKTKKKTRNSSKITCP